MTRILWLIGALVLTGLASIRPVDAASCRDAMGSAKADLYVRACLAITSATHPPCNAANTCETIGSHIREMCAQDPNAPGWCKAYRTTAVPDPPPPLPVPRPGFDCAKAASPVEREICAGGHDELADDDRLMTTMFGHLLTTAKDPAALRASQRAFVQERQACAAPEPGRPTEGLPLVHCIAALTHERIDELKALSPGSTTRLWNAAGPPDPCGASFGDDGWDQLAVQVKTSQVAFTWSDLRDIVLRPTDAVGFDVDGTVWPARIATDPDGQTMALASDARLLAALDHGTIVRVRRNSKVILRAPLAACPAAIAQGRHLCQQAGR